jgi:SAM-dependent methyltransferase
VKPLATLSQGYFDGLYASSPDPWEFETRWYEARKYALSLALLPAERYGAAFEAGCSIGVLTERLAPRCGRLLACDGAATAVRLATVRTASLTNVTVERRVIPRDWPPGRFDLIVFSEFLYYFGGGDLGRVLDLGAAALRRGGNMLAVHWRHPVAEYPRSGGDVHRALRSHPGLTRLVGHQEPDFLAEVYTPAGDRAVSVAAAEGLV